MTDHELDAWMSLLGRTKAQRREIVRDLLQHANGDQMTEDDRRLCRLALERLTPHAREPVSDVGHVSIYRRRSIERSA